MSSMAFGRVRVLCPNLRPWADLRAFGSLWCVGLMGPNLALFSSLGKTFLLHAWFWSFMHVIGHLVRDLVEDFLETSRGLSVD